MAAKFKCEACEKHKRKPMESVVAPYSPATPGKVIETDGFYWTDPRSNQVWTGTYIVDTGTRLSGGAINLKGKLMRSGEEFRRTLKNRWMMYYGRPAALRLDGEGCHIEKRVKEWFASRGIMVDVTARQSHNQLALCERNIGILKDTMSKIAEESEDDVTAEEIFAEAIDAMNDLGRYKGHSPYEMMLGRTPEPTV